MRLLKVLVGIVVLAFLALVGYAYLGDMAPRQQEMRQPVSLDVGAAGNGPASAPATASDAGAEDTATEEDAGETDPNDLE